MSAAIDVSSSDAPSLNFSQPLGREAGPEATGVMRAGLRAICSSGDEAVVLQQLIYWSRVRETDWVQLSASYIGDPLCIPSRTVAECLGRLAEQGFISSRQNSPGEAKWHRVHADTILDALEEAGFDADRESLFGHPRETCDPPSRDSQPPPSRDSRQEEQQEQEEDYKDSVADGCGREADRERSDAAAATAPNISNLEEHIRKAFEAYGVSEEQARTIRETLTETFGLSDSMIREWIGERVGDFAGRPRQLSRREVVRYTTSRQDLVDRGYIPPLTVATSAAEPEQTDPDDSESQQDQRFFSRADELFEEHDLPFDDAVEQARAEAREKGWTIPDDWKETTDE